MQEEKLSTEEKMKRTRRMSIEEARKILETFTEKMGSLTLATVSQAGEPFASYAPFVKYENNYYVVLSGHVQHSHNLANNQKASLLFIEDESVTLHIFGRRRFYCQAKAEKFLENDERAKIIHEIFIRKFGNKARMILGMEDFRIYELKPFNASLVLGFGAAFHVSDDEKTLTAKNARHQEEHEKNLNQ